MIAHDHVVGTGGKADDNGFNRAMNKMPIAFGRAGILSKSLAMAVLCRTVP
jgi:hypothetical protein